MSINRHNYEMYFLLFVDKELSDKDINALHLFILENEDLKSELEMLQESVLQPEKICYKEKEVLLKNLNALKVMQEKLLLFIDNELSPAKIKILQKELAADENMTAELIIFQNTKLTPDSNIIYTNKQSLYKKDSDKVIGFGWMKFAIAAIFFGFVIWGTSLYFNSNNGIKSKKTAAVAEVEKISVNTPLAEIPVLHNDTEAVVIPRYKMETTGKTKAELVQNKKLVKITSSNKVITVAENNKVDIDQKINLKANKILTKPYREEATNNEEEPAIQVTESMQKINKNLQVFANHSNKGNEPQQILKSAVFNASFSANSDQNKMETFNLSEDEPKKNRLTGFFRKAKRILERNTNFDNGDNNLKVANLAFTTH